MYETASQFILAEDGITFDEGAKSYEIVWNNNLGMSNSENFPQFELHIETYGVFGWNYGLTINFRGIETKRVGSSNELEEIVITLLNKLKKGNYEQEMISFHKERFSEEKLEMINSIYCYKNPKITSLENEVTNLKQKIKELTKLSLQFENEELKRENERLHEKISAFKEILS